MVFLTTSTGLWWLNGAFYTLTSGKPADLYITRHKTSPRDMKPANAGDLHDLIEVIFEVDTIMDKRYKQK
jgi:hypothetical protein